MLRVDTPFCGGCGLESAYGVHRPHCPQVSRSQSGSDRPATKETASLIGLPGTRRRRSQSSMRVRMARGGSPSSSPAGTVRTAGRTKQRRRAFGASKYSPSNSARPNHSHPVADFISGVTLAFMFGFAALILFGWLTPSPEAVEWITRFGASVQGLVAR